MAKETSIIECTNKHREQIPHLTATDTITETEREWKFTLNRVNFWKFTRVEWIFTAEKIGIIKWKILQKLREEWFSRTALRWMLWLSEDKLTTDEVWNSILRFASSLPHPWVTLRPPARETYHSTILCERRQKEVHGNSWQCHSRWTKHRKTRGSTANHRKEGTRRSGMEKLKIRRRFPSYKDDRPQATDGGVRHSSISSSSITASLQ